MLAQNTVVVSPGKHTPKERSIYLCFCTSSRGVRLPRALCSRISPELIFVLYRAEWYGWDPKHPKINISETSCKGLLINWNTAAEHQVLRWRYTVKFQLLLPLVDLTTYYIYKLGSWAKPFQIWHEFCSYRILNSRSWINPQKVGHPCSWKAESAGSSVLVSGLA